MVIQVLQNFPNCRFGIQLALRSIHHGLFQTGRKQMRIGQRYFPVRADEAFFTMIPRYFPESGFQQLPVQLPHDHLKFTFKLLKAGLVFHRL